MTKREIIIIVYAVFAMLFLGQYSRWDERHCPDKTPNLVAVVGFSAWPALLTTALVMQSIRGEAPRTCRLNED
jgi:hypothetical protein